jgi:hypothetical protein
MLEFLTKFARPHCPVEAKQFWGWGATRLQKSSNNHGARGEPSASDDQRAAPIKQTISKQITARRTI